MRLIVAQVSVAKAVDLRFENRPWSIENRILLEQPLQPSGERAGLGISFPRIFCRAEVLEDIPWNTFGESVCPADCRVWFLQSRGHCATLDVGGSSGKAYVLDAPRTGGNVDERKMKAESVEEHDGRISGFGIRKSMRRRMAILCRRGFDFAWPTIHQFPPPIHNLRTNNHQRSPDRNNHQRSPETAARQPPPDAGSCPTFAEARNQSAEAEGIAGARLGRKRGEGLNKRTKATGMRWSTDTG